MTGNVRLDSLLFYRMFPELKDPSLQFLKQQWGLAVQYAESQPVLFPVCDVKTMHWLLAHIVKLNLMAQMGSSILVPAPSNVAAFKAWLNQTTYGQALGS